MKGKTSDKFLCSQYIPSLLVIGLAFATACTSASVPNLPSRELVLLSTWEEQKVFEVSWSPTQNIFFTSTLGINGSRELWAYDVTSSRVLWSVDTFSSSAAVSPDGKFVAETHWLQGFVRLRNSSDGKVNKDLEVNNCTGGNLAAFVQDNKTLIVGKKALPQEEYSNINLWDLETGGCEKILSFEGYLTFLSINTKMDLIAYGSYNLYNEVITWSIAKKSELCRWKGDFGLFVSSKDTLLLSTNNKLSFLDPNNCASQKEYSVASFFTNYIDFTSDGSFFVVADSNSLQMRNESDGNLLTQKNIGKVFDQSLYGQRIFISPDGNFFIVVFANQANDDQRESIQLWQIK
jgi:hypothetical protein